MSRKCLRTIPISPDVGEREGSIYLVISFSFFQMPVQTAQASVMMGLEKKLHSVITVIAYSLLPHPAHFVASSAAPALADQDSRGGEWENPKS